MSSQKITSGEASLTLEKGKEAVASGRGPLLKPYHH